MNIQHLAYHISSLASSFPSHTLLFSFQRCTVIHVLRTGFHPISFEPGTDTMGPDLFFAPDPQLAFAPSRKSFDREVDNEEFDLELSFKLQGI